MAKKKRINNIKDEMVAKSTAYSTASTPSAGDTILTKTIIAPSVGAAVMGIAISWSGAGVGVFGIYKGSDLVYPITLGALDGDVYKIIGRIDFVPSETITVKSINTQTGDVSAALVYAEW